MNMLNKSSRHIKLATLVVDFVASVSFVEMVEEIREEREERLKGGLSSTL